MMSFSSNRKTFFKKTFTFIFFFVVFLLVENQLIAYWKPVILEELNSDSFPHYRKRIFHDELTTRDLKLFLNLHEIAQSKPENSFRIGLLGDSSIGVPWYKEEGSLGYELQKKISEYTPTPVKIFNLSVASSDALNQFYLLSEITKYDLDLIVWQISIRSFPNIMASVEKSILLDKENHPKFQKLLNQYTKKIQLTKYSDQFREPNDHYDQDSYFSFWETFKTRYYYKLYILGTLDRLFNLDLLRSDARKINRYRDIRPIRKKFVNGQSKKLFTHKDYPLENNPHYEIIEVVRKFLKKNGIRLIIYNSPIFALEETYEKYLYEKYLEKISNFFSKNLETKFIDFHNKVPEKFAEDYIHLKSDGNRLMAETLSEYLKKNYRFNNIN